jgi:hypothetical protein
VPERIYGHLPTFHCNSIITHDSYKKNEAKGVIGLLSPGEPTGTKNPLKYNICTAPECKVYYDIPWKILQYKNPKLIKKI